MYSEINLLKLEKEFNELNEKYANTLLNLGYLASTLNNMEAREYVCMGLGGA